jgi:hypothetical protein
MESTGDKNSLDWMAMGVECPSESCVDDSGLEASSSGRVGGGDGLAGMVSKGVDTDAAKGADADAEPVTGLGGSNIFSRANAENMSFWNGFLGKAFPWLSSPSLTRKVPATGSDANVSLLGWATAVGVGSLLLSLLAFAISRSRASPSEPEIDVGGESRPLAERT